MIVRINYNGTRIGTSMGISVEGYGDKGSLPGHGEVALLERYEGRLRLIVWSDIKQEDPTHIIDLEGARENNLGQG